EPVGAVIDDVAQRASVVAHVSSGASNDLARQLIAGARADLFVSADAAQMDVVERAGLVRADARVHVASNTLVVIVPTSSHAELTRAVDFPSMHPMRRLAIADPSAVPVGMYARGWLERTGVWDAVRDRIVPT